MTLDLVLRNGHFGDGRALDLGIRNGAIAAIEPGLPAGGESLELGGSLITAGLVETHIHLDKSRILDRCTPPPVGVADYMQRVADVKPTFTVEDVYERARHTLEQCLLHGATLMRTHVEVDPNVGLVGFEALKQLAADYRWAIDIEFCVFAQEGLTNAPETDANRVAALKDGATVVGGAPGFDPDHGGQIERIFELARAFDVDVDIHLDAGATADDMDIHQVCDLTDKFGWGGRVAIGHGTKYSLLPPAALRALGQRLANAGVAVTVLPATDLFVMGRHQDHGVMRGVADANALMACGVNCSLSTNNVMNPFTPYGDCSLTRMANLYANVLHRGSDEELTDCFDMLSSRSARLLRRDDHGIAVGKAADIIVWDAASPADAVAKVAHPLYGFKRGQRTFTRARAELHKPGEN